MEGNLYDKTIFLWDNKIQICTIQVPHTKENMGNIRTDLLKFAEGNIYEEHQKFITTFDEKWRMDENIILIMCAIVLFTSARSRVIHKDVIRLEQVSLVSSFLEINNSPSSISP